MAVGFSLHRVVSLLADSRGHPRELEGADDFDRVMDANAMAATATPELERPVDPPSLAVLLGRGDNRHDAPRNARRQRIEHTCDGKPPFPAFSVSKPEEDIDPS